MTTPDPVKDSPRRGSWKRTVLSFVIALLVAGLVKGLVFQVFYIPSASMENTLHGCTGCIADRVLISRLSYDFTSVRRGDIVVFDANGPFEYKHTTSGVAPLTPHPTGAAALWDDVRSAFGFVHTGEVDYVKRVIALPGDTVQCCDASGHVLVNGKPVFEPYVFETDHAVGDQPFGPVLVPAGRVWVMGDHRDDSADSRYHTDNGFSGTVPESAIVGKVIFRVWPFSRIGAPR